RLPIQPERAASSLFDWAKTQTGRIGDPVQHVRVAEDGRPWLPVDLSPFAWDQAPGLEPHLTSSSSL
ncbi:MAG: hypothetical protein ACYCZU_09190, partial [Devosia sp.]